VLVRPLRVEAVLLTILVFLGVNVAWLLLFEECLGAAWEGRATKSPRWADP
jgi:hypothetical protein